MFQPWPAPHCAEVSEPSCRLGACKSLATVSLGDICFSSFKIRQNRTRHSWHLDRGQNCTFINLPTLTHTPLHYTHTPKKKTFSSNHPTAQSHITKLPHYPQWSRCTLERVESNSTSLFCSCQESTNVSPNPDLSLGTNRNHLS